jgi:hypothetical protein
MDSISSRVSGFNDHYRPGWIPFLMGKVGGCGFFVGG